MVPCCCAAAVPRHYRGGLGCGRRRSVLSKVLAMRPGVSPVHCFNTPFKVCAHLSSGQTTTCLPSAQDLLASGYSLADRRGNPCRCGIRLFALCERNQKQVTVLSKHRETPTMTALPCIGCSFKGSARSLALHPHRVMAAIALGKRTLPRSCCLIHVCLNYVASHEGVELC